MTVGEEHIKFANAFVFKTPEIGTPSRSHLELFVGEIVAWREP